MLDLGCMEKTEIHRHLEGCIRPSTAFELSQDNGLIAVDQDFETFERGLVIRSPIPLLEALDRFDRFRAPIRGRRAVARIVREAIHDAAADNVRRLELRFSPLTLASSSGLSLAELFDIIRQVSPQAAKEAGLLALSWVVVISRRRGLEGAWKVVRAVQHYGTDWIAGVDFASDEARHRTAEFAAVAQTLNNLGLPLTVHTGEGVGPEHVAEALALPGVRRLGHGLSLVQDPQLLAEVVRRQIVVEVCPTSNLRAGVVAHLGQHPLHRMREVGVAVVFCADDPTLFDIELSDELRLLRSEFGLSDDALTHAEERARAAMLVAGTPLI